MPVDPRSDEWAIERDSCARGDCSVECRSRESRANPLPFVVGVNLRVGERHAVGSALVFGKADDASVELGLPAAQRRVVLDLHRSKRILDFADGPE